MASMLRDEVDFFLSLRRHIFSLSLRQEEGEMDSKMKSNTANVLHLSLILSVCLPKKFKKTVEYLS